MTKVHPSCVLLGFPLSIMCGHAYFNQPIYNYPFPSTPSIFDRIDDPTSALLVEPARGILEWI